MRHQEELTIQSLTQNEDLKVGYSDNDIVIVDSIQTYTEECRAHMTMNSILLCTNGRMNAKMNGMELELSRHQLAVIPENVMMTEVMVSPDFNMKTIFLTNDILQSFLHEKMNVWNDMLYVHKSHIITIDEEREKMFGHFYDLLLHHLKHYQENPYMLDVVHSLIRSEILALCGMMKQTLPAGTKSNIIKSANGHFQQFLDLIHSSNVKYRPVEDYAAELCITPKYLSAICKRQSGKTASEWIREQVIADIRYRLLQTDMSIKEISNVMNFPNPSFFGRYVKLYLSVTPQQYRNNNILKTD